MLVALIWLKGLVAVRSERVLGTMAGIALTIALLVSIGAFSAASSESMTRRAIADVSIDWQIQLAPGTDARAVGAFMARATGYNSLESVNFADVAGFTATTEGTVQTTGPGKALGLGPQYQASFPSELRPLLGAADGVLLAQQTAANLHVGIGDTITVFRQGLPPVEVRVDGVVDLPDADSLFQVVGIAPGLAPQAPPDNVLLLPTRQWHQLFDPLGASRPDLVRTQLHVRLRRDLPVDPEAALQQVQRLARNFEARNAGSAAVANNLAARLEAVRSDALYARVLFLFLGLPGVVLAVLLTIAVSASGSNRRRREQALLRARGASTSRIIALASCEALLVAVGGLILGLPLALAASWTLAPTNVLTSERGLLWTTGAAVCGFAIGMLSMIYPAWADARRTTVSAALSVVGRPSTPAWQRICLDALCLMASGLVFWRQSSSGYQVVLAPEGVASASVSYEALLAPLCLWIGLGLFAWRLCDVGLARGRRALTRLLRPLAWELAAVVAAGIARQRSLISRGAVLVGLALSFATSTAVFNTTYQAQARLDAELTNGADVLVSGTTEAPPTSRLAELAAQPGVTGLQTMQHRYAYVGTDLQDLYGIDPLRIGEATSIADSFFAGGHAAATLAALAERPDGLLVSDETVSDFQLELGDLVNLRLQDARDHQYRVVPFHFLGVVREFPTAPKDSFLVANASYIAQQTGGDAAEIVLLRSDGRAAELAELVRPVVASLPGARVTDIDSAQRTISSSLTSVDLRGLTHLELAFAVVLVAGATGLILALGLAERRRNYAILSALGASRRQLAVFIWSEGLLILTAGGVIGVTVGLAVAQMLVVLLSGVFDPPPESLSVPWLYLALLIAAAIGSTVLAIQGALLAARRPIVEALREI